MECLHQFTGQQQVTLLTGWQFMSGTTNNEAKNTSAVINSSARRSRNDIASAYVPTRYMHLWHFHFLWRASAHTNLLTRQIYLFVCQRASPLAEIWVHACVTRPNMVAARYRKCGLGPTGATCTAIKTKRAARLSRDRESALRPLGANKWLAQSARSGHKKAMRASAYWMRAEMDGWWKGVLRVMQRGRRVAFLLWFDAVEQREADSCNRLSRHFDLFSPALRAAKLIKK